MRKKRPLSYRRDEVGDTIAIRIFAQTLCETSIPAFYHGYCLGRLNLDFFAHLEEVFDY
jgi:hypothetical protein